MLKKPNKKQIEMLGDIGEAIAFFTGGAESEAQKQVREYVSVVREMDLKLNEAKRAEQKSQELLEKAEKLMIEAAAAEGKNIKDKENIDASKSDLKSEKSLFLAEKRSFDAWKANVEVDIASKESAAKKALASAEKTKAEAEAALGEAQRLKQDYESKLGAIKQITGG